MHYLAFDPGEHTGWASFDEKGGLHQVGTYLTPNDLMGELVKNIPYPTTFNHLPKLIICESFKLFPWKSQAQMWSEFWTVQVIGSIKLFAKFYRIPIEMQDPNIKDIGYMYAGTAKPKSNNPLRHQMDAYVHGVYYLQKAKIRRPQQAKEIS